MDAEAKGRDEALERLDAAHGDLIAAARDIAHALSADGRPVTSTAVFAELRRLGLYDARDGRDPRDPRFMGVVFRGRQWERVGWDSSGSHKRPVAIWRRRDA